MRLLESCRLPSRPPWMHRARLEIANAATRGRASRAQCGHIGPMLSLVSALTASRHERPNWTPIFPYLGIGGTTTLLMGLTLAPAGYA
jgi:hypothetical protein